MQQIKITPIHMARSLWCNRELIYITTKQEVNSRYRSTILGMIWPIVTPIIMLTIYTFVFSTVLKVKWSDDLGSKTEFAFLLYAGLIVFNFFAESITNSPNIIITKPNYVKKITYPLEILPVITMLTALYHTLISIGVWIAAYLLFLGMPKPTFLLLPIILIPIANIILGLSWILASLGVYFRDITQFISLVVTALMFLSPIFYPISILPEKYRIIFYLNPITIGVEVIRDLLFWGKITDPKILTIYWIYAVLIVWIGFAFFQKTKNGFADVI